MSAKTDQYDRVKEIFSGVCDLSARDRAPILDRECDTDEVLRDEVEALLKLRDAGPTTSLTLPPDVPALPRIIGRYRVLREIGRGAMGIVYLGVPQDDQFRHPVAIKVLQRDMDTAEILRRFDLEWHLMAALNHPGLVRLYEGGQTSDGLPYFTMEYVEGEPIDDYCDTHRLGIAERLELFRQVCAAVHHAHQNLVVHRDLKPSHILVNQAGIPKVLDFSIAKLLTPRVPLLDGPPSTWDTRIMTPQYASPEQVRGNPLTTASDIYSLGIILYKLVTGHRPYGVDRHARSELERVICEFEPAKPSNVVMPALASRAHEDSPRRLRRRLAGDIDHIVMKALCKEPQRRYQSAAQFAEDIRRHLAHLPVSARRDTAGYRCVKFMRRHRTAVVAAALVAVVVVAWGYSVGKLWAEDVRQSQQVSEERDRARRMLDQTLDFTNAVIFDLHDEIDHLDGSLAARQQLAAAAQECFDGLAADVGSDTALKMALASAYDRVGDIRRGTGNPSPGNITEVLESYCAGLRLREELRQELPDDPRVRRQLAMSHKQIGDMLLEAGNLDGALDSYQQHLRVQRALARVQLETGHLLAAENTLESARAIYEFLHAAQPQHAGCRRGLADTLYCLSRVRHQRGYVDESRALAERALALLQSMPGRAAEALRDSIEAVLDATP